MRRTIAALTLALLAAGLPVADAAKPPTIAGLTYVVGYGSASIDVTAPKGAVLRASAPPGGVAPQFATFLYGGEWGAVALLGRGPKPVRVMQVRTAKPDHCPSQLATPATPIGRCRTDLEHAVVTGATLSGSGANAGYPIPAGTYQLVVSGPPNEFTVAMLSFAGLKGAKGFGAARRVNTAFQRVRTEHMVHAKITGAFSQKVTGNAVAVMGTWHATSDGENGAYQFAQCVAPGAAGPLDPDACAARQAVDAAATRPVFAAAEAGPSSDAKIGQTTHVTPVLKPGTYANAYRVNRLGDGPAAGAFVWWLQADALK